MKRTKYLVTAIFLSVFLAATSAVAATHASSGAGPADPPATLQDVQEQQVENDLKVSRKKIEDARKKVVAKVNGVPINMYDLLGMMNRVAKAYYSHVKEPTDEITKEIKQQALDRLIFEELAVKEAIKQGVEPKPEDVQKVIDQIKQAYGAAEGYQRYLDDLALTEEQLRARIIRSRRLEGITGREVYQKVTKKEDVFKKAYEEYKEAGKLRKADDFLVKEVLVMAGEDEKATRATAEKLLAKLKANNNDFGKLLLDGTFIVRRISIKKEKYPVVYEKMKTMKVGQFSGIVEDGGTFHIFKVLKNEPSRDMTEEEARGFIEDRLAPYFQDQRRAEWIKELRKDAKIEIFEEDLKSEVKSEK